VHVAGSFGVDWVDGDRLGGGARLGEGLYVVAGDLLA
jgi:hypothetical protein